MSKKKGIPLLLSNPELAKEWNKELNGPLTRKILACSGKNACWLCSECGYKFNQVIAKRTTRGQGCPVCSGRVASSKYNLLIVNPTLCMDWDIEANGNKKPEMYLPQSMHKAYWRCPHNPDHRWQENIRYRHRYGRGCPKCKEENLVKNSLLALNPELVKQWNKEKNYPLMPDRITPGCNSIVDWICEKDPRHKWSASINSRVKGNGCPYCANKKVHISNCLATVSPNLAKEWHEELNGNTSAYDVLPGAKEKRWWTCPLGHNYEASPNKRTSGQNCPYCTHHKVSDDNRLSVIRPDIALMWHQEKNGSLTPHQVSIFSDKKAFFICNRGHEFQTCIKSIVKSRRGGCKYCYGREASPEWNLLKVFPDIAVQLYPALNSVSPENISPYSNKKLIWLCPAGHSYLMKVCNKTLGGQCTKCFRKQSRIELRIFYELATIFDDIDTRKIGRYQLDIYIPHLNLGIEYDGEYYHRNRTVNDLTKNAIFRDKGIEIIRIRENPLKKLQRHDICISCNADIKATMNRVLMAINKKFGQSFRTKKKINSYLNSDIVQNDSEYKKRLRNENLSCKVRVVRKVS